MDMRGNIGLQAVVRVLVVVGLAIDAYVHFHLAYQFKYNTDGVISGDWVFRLEATAATVAALLVLVRANRVTYLIAFLVAAAGTFAVVAFTEWNLGKIGPLPTIYDPFWYTEKTISLVGEAVAAVAALVGIFLQPMRRLRPAK